MNVSKHIAQAGAGTACPMGSESSDALQLPIWGHAEDTKNPLRRYDTVHKYGETRSVRLGDLAEGRGTYVKINVKLNEIKSKIKSKIK